jgi:hypothetical protein
MPVNSSSSGNPLSSANFLLEVEDRRVSLSAVSELHDLIENEADPSVRQCVCLRRAVSEDRFLYSWYRDTRLGKETTRNVTLMLLDSPGGKAAHAWRLDAAKPVRWTGPRFDALGDDLAMEELELHYKTVTWVDL